MSVTFKSKQKALSVSHDDIFHVGVQYGGYSIHADGTKHWVGSEDALEKRNSLPDSDMVNKAYHFYEGEDHNLLTLDNEDAIEGMRAYIQYRGDNLIVELDDEGNALVEDPEGTIFTAKRKNFVLYPAMYGGYTGASGKTFYFNMGENMDQYITSDEDEIAVLSAYALSTHRIIKSASE